MCGIVGYIGNKPAYPILLKGLKRLEYRGYDSAGVAIINGTELEMYKCKGKVVNLEGIVVEEEMTGTIGIGHTRWATHGVPNDVNAHPHFSENEELAIIHNGIIENYHPLKKELLKRGYSFKSDTDTEVLIKLIEEIHKNGKYELFEAVRFALKEVVGAYALVVINKKNPDQLIAAKMGSPLVVGIGEENEFFFASDATPIIEYTKNVVYLEDGEIASVDRAKGLKIKTIKNKNVKPFIQELEMNLETLELGGYPHFMLKEIYEQPRSVHDSMRGRIQVNLGMVALGGMRDYMDKMANAKRIIIVACGTSWHSALLAEYLIEDLARIPVEVEYASEFRYRNPVINEDDVVIAISQSGETADTLAAIKLAKSKGALIYGICNVIGSSIARESHTGSYTHAGPEIGVASTKAFTAQLTALMLMALVLGKERGTVENSEFQRLLIGMDALPEKLEKVLKTNDQVYKIAEKFQDVSNMLYLGRGVNFPVALEGALKLKEISYIHAEGYPAAEMKHGPIALIDENMPVIIIATKDASYEKVVSNMQEVKARGGVVIAIVTEGDSQVKGMVDHVIEIPDTENLLVPFLSVIPLQLLSYHIAVMRGCNVDQPRNLAKSVTVE
ncbi:MAG: glucosamine--fructose-6-phosphate aminotransferase (isomerizing) [Patiriisocius sp.]|jgi:glucosamine--fructose-6-phosphate aminotransferase (isomerizing)